MGYCGGFGGPPIILPRPPRHGPPRHSGQPLSSLNFSVLFLSALRQAHQLFFNQIAEHRIDQSRPRELVEFLPPYSVRNKFDGAGAGPYEAEQDPFDPILVL